jgi:hypothetical protein
MDRSLCISKDRSLQNVKFTNQNRDTPPKNFEEIKAHSSPTMTDSKKRKERIPVQRRYSWLDHFDTLAHNTITLYEWEMYARTRMIALMSLCKAHDETESEEVRKAASEHWRFREYPTHTGAKKHILQALGEHAVQREHSHQVIAMGYLALIARHNPEMRESLIYAELLWYRYQKSLSLLDDDDNDSSGDEDAELRQLCASFDRFWSRSEENIFESKSAHFVSSARKIERDWMEEAPGVKK